jgi:hypothetical protein
MNELLKANVTVILNLEYLGVRIEEVKDEYGNIGILPKIAYYYSVPESSTLEVENVDLNEKIKTANALKHLAKETLIDMIINNCEKEFGEDDGFIADLKNNVDDYCKFYAKVRHGEVWNKELAEQRIKDIDREIDAVIGYEEI